MIDIPRSTFPDALVWLSKRKISKLVIITDNRLNKLYGSFLKKSFKRIGFSIFLFSFPGGEKHKNYHTWKKIIAAMEKEHCDRDTFILSVGGGVVGDIAGFVAATYLRGIAYAQIPTTLLSMVDSSIGGKTGINTLHGKNRVGCIYQPQMIVTDICWLETLPKKHLINGLIEAIKMFATHDADSFHFVSIHLTKILNGDKTILKEIVSRAMNIKTGVVMRDEKEQGERVVLNFGHTIGHALEKLSKYTLLHGNAVAYGMLVESMMAYHLGLLSRDQLVVFYRLLEHLGFQGRHLKKYNVSSLIRLTKKDKKARSQLVNYILLQEIGNVYKTDNHYAHPVSDKIVRQAFNYTLKGLL